MAKAKFIGLDECIGLTVQDVFDDDDVLWIAFTDGTYTRMEASADGCGSDCCEPQGYVRVADVDRIRPYDATVMRDMKILDEDGFQKAMDDYSKEIQHARDRQEVEDRKKLRDLLAKYPDEAKKVKESGHVA